MKTAVLFAWLFLLCLGGCTTLRHHQETNFRHELDTVVIDLTCTQYTTLGELLKSIESTANKQLTHREKATLMLPDISLKIFTLRRASVLTAVKYASALHDLDFTLDATTRKIVFKKMVPPQEIKLSSHDRDQALQLKRNNTILTTDELLAKKNHYDGTMVRVAGYYRVEFECSVLFRNAVEAKEFQRDASIEISCGVPWTEVIGSGKCEGSGQRIFTGYFKCRSKSDADRLANTTLNVVMIETPGKDE